jgi:Fe2+ transport system protein FeoA
MCCLPELSTGESGTVERVLGPDALVQFWENHGIVQGARARVERAAPLGDPTIYRVDEQLIAIRREDALQILVIREKA